MKIIKSMLKILAKIFQFHSESKQEKIEYSRKHYSKSFVRSNDTKINPANGLPMVGCLDLNGNSFGTNSSLNDDRYRSNDYFRDNSFTNYSSYDPFSNRY